MTIVTHGFGEGALVTLGYGYTDGDVTHEIVNIELETENLAPFELESSFENVVDFELEADLEKRDVRVGYYPPGIGYGMDCGGIYLWCQQFTLTDPVIITGVNVPIYKNVANPPTLPFIIEIKELDGLGWPTGATLAQILIDPADAPSTVDTWEIYDFASPLVLTVGVKYGFMYRSDEIASKWKISLNHLYPASYPGGEFVYSNRSPPVWRKITQYDLPFGFIVESNILQGVERFILDREKTQLVNLDLDNVHMVAVGGIDQQQMIHPPPSISSTGLMLAQTFTPSITGGLWRMNMGGAWNYSAPNYIRWAIYNTVGGLPNTRISSWVYTNYTRGWEAPDHYVNFNGEVAVLQAGTMYAFVSEVQVSGNRSWKMNATGPYLGGRACEYTGGSWKFLYTWDALFEEWLVSEIGVTKEFELELIDESVAPDIHEIGLDVDSLREIDLELGEIAEGVRGEYWYRTTGMGGGSAIWLNSWWCQRFEVEHIFEAQWFETNVAVTSDSRPPVTPLVVMICPLKPDDTPDLNVVIARRELTKDDIPYGSGGWSDKWRTFEFTTKGWLMPDVRYGFVVTSVAPSQSNYNYWHHNVQPCYYHHGTETRSTNQGLTWSGYSECLKKIHIWQADANSKMIRNNGVICKDASIELDVAMGELQTSGTVISYLTITGCSWSWFASNLKWGQRFIAVTADPVARVKMYVKKRVGYIDPVSEFIEIYETSGGAPVEPPIFKETFGKAGLSDNGNWAIFNLTGCPALVPGNMYIVIMGTDDPVGAGRIAYGGNGYLLGSSLYKYNGVWYDTTPAGTDIPFYVLQGTVTLIPHKVEFALNIEEEDTEEFEL
jgi:hypothetical protein